MRIALRSAPQQAIMAGTWLAALLTLTHLAVDAVASMPAALLPSIQARYGLTETGLAMLVAVLSFSSSVTQPLFGALADRLGQRRVGGLGAILTVAVLSLIGVTPSIALLVLLFLIGGVGSAAFHPAGASMTRGAGVKHKGLAMSLFSAGGTVGVALGPILVVSVVAVYGLNATPWLMAPGIVLGLLIWLAGRPQPRAPSSPGAAKVGLRIVRGPVGLLVLAGLFNSIVVVTFNSALPLWLVSQGISRDSAVIGWTLAAFALAAASGGIIASTLMQRVPRAYLASGTMLLALLPLLAIFVVEPGTPLFFAAVVLAGALVQASFPLLVVSAQDLVPDAVATVSGMLMGFSTGVAGMLYIGIGYLQTTLGVGRAMQLAFLALIPAAAIAFTVLTRARVAIEQSPEKPGTDACSCTVCRCAQCSVAGLDRQLVAAQ